MATKNPPGALPGWIVWGLYALILSLVVAHAPAKHSVTVYRDAAALWTAHADLYELRMADGSPSIHGFLYLPQSALLFVPLAKLPLAAGEILWRLLGLAFLAGAAWKLARRFAPLRNAPSFLLLTALLLPATFASARNGQANLPFAACLLWAALDLLDARWNRAALLLLLAMALKPLALVPILLAAAVWPPLRLRLLAGLGLFLALPFLDPDWGYVARQYSLCWQKLQIAREPMEHGFADFSGMVWTFAGRPLSEAVIQAVGIVMAFATLVLARIAQRRTDPAGGPFWVIALAASYLMLFNPRTEMNSYVVLAAAALPFLADARVRRAGGETAFLVALLLSFGAESYGKPIDPWTRLWLKPLMASTFMGWLGWRLLKGIKPVPVQSTAGSKPV